MANNYIDILDGYINEIKKNKDQADEPTKDNYLDILDEELAKISAPKKQEEQVITTPPTIISETQPPVTPVQQPKRKEMPWWEKEVYKKLTPEDIKKQIANASEGEKLLAGLKEYKGPHKKGIEELQKEYREKGTLYEGGPELSGFEKLQLNAIAGLMKPSLPITRILGAPKEITSDLAKNIEIAEQYKSKGLGGSLVEAATSLVPTFGPMAAIGFFGPAVIGLVEALPTAVEYAKEGKYDKALATLAIPAAAGLAMGGVGKASSLIKSKPLEVLANAVGFPAIGTAESLITSGKFPGITELLSQGIQGAAWGGVGIYNKGKAEAKFKQIESELKEVGSFLESQTNEAIKQSERTAREFKRIDKDIKSGKKVTPEEKELYDKASTLKAQETVVEEQKQPLVPEPIQPITQEPIKKGISTPEGYEEIVKEAEGKPVEVEEIETPTPQSGGLGKISGEEVIRPRQVDVYANGQFEVKGGSADQPRASANKAESKATAQGEWREGKGWIRLWGNEGDWAKVKTTLEKEFPNGIKAGGEEGKFTATGKVKPEEFEKLGAPIKEVPEPKTTVQETEKTPMADVSISSDASAAGVGDPNQPLPSPPKMTTPEGGTVDLPFEVGYSQHRKWVNDYLGAIRLKQKSLKYAILNTELAKRMSRKFIDKYTVDKVLDGMLKQDIYTPGDIITYKELLKKLNANYDVYKDSIETLSKRVSEKVLTPAGQELQILSSVSLLEDPNLFHARQIKSLFVTDKGKPNWLGKKRAIAERKAELESERTGEDLDTVTKRYYDKMNIPYVHEETIKNLAQKSAQAQKITDALDHVDKASHDIESIRSNKKTYDKLTEYDRYLDLLSGMEKELYEQRNKFTTIRGEGESFRFDVDYPKMRALMNEIESGKNEMLKQNPEFTNQFKNIQAEKNKVLARLKNKKVGSVDFVKESNTLKKLITDQEVVTRKLVDQINKDAIEESKDFYFPEMFEEGGEVAPSVANKGSIQQKAMDNLFKKDIALKDKLSGLRDVINEQKTEWRKYARNMDKETQREIYRAAQDESREYQDYLKEVFEKEFKEPLDVGNVWEKVKDNLFDNISKTENEIFDIIKGDIPISTWHKIDAIQTIHQLLQVKSFLRNVLGSYTLKVSDTLSQQMFGLMFDGALAKITGNRTIAKRTRAELFKIIGRSPKQIRENAIREYKQGTTNSVRSIERATGFKIKGSLENQLQFRVGHTFKGGFYKTLEKLTGRIMTVPDRIFFESRFYETIDNQIRANKGGRISLEMFDNALMEASKMTFRDMNFISEFLIEFKKTLNKITTLGATEQFGGGSVVSKYPKTTGGIIMRAWEYTLPHLLSTYFREYRPFKKTGGESYRKGVTLSQREIAVEMGKGALGSLITLIGGVMGASGLSNPGSDDNKKVRNFNTAMGKRPNSIKIPGLNLYVDISQLMPMSMVYSMGVSMGSATRKLLKKKSISALGDVADALYSAGWQASEPFTQHSMFRGMARLAGASSEGPMGLQNAILSIFTDIPSSLVPQVFAQGRYVVDPSRRDPYAMVNFANRTIDGIFNKVPGLSQFLSKKVDVFGRDIKYSLREDIPGGPAVGMALDIVSSFFSPFIITKLKNSKELKFIEMMYDTTQDPLTLPTEKEPQISIEGVKIKLTPEQRNFYQKQIGDYVSNYVLQLVNSGYDYSKMSTEEKVDLMKSIYAEAEKVGLDELRRLLEKQR